MKTATGKVMAGIVLAGLSATAAGDFPRWKKRGVDWFAGTSDWGAMAAGFRRFRKECDEVV